MLMVLLEHNTQGIQVIMDSSSISLEVDDSVFCSYCSECAEAQHHITACGGYFFRPRMELNKHGVCNALADSTAKDTMAISAPSDRLGLLLGLPTERSDMVLIRYGHQL